MKKDKLLSLFDDFKNEDHSLPNNPNDKVMIVDGLNTFIRVWSCVPTMNDDGLHIGGISGTLQSIAKYVRQFNPTRLVIVFDGEGGSYRRKKVYPEYKEKRKTRKLRVNRTYEEMQTEDEEHESQVRQLVRLSEYLQCLPVSLLVIPKVEADDVIAYIATKLLTNENNKEAIIMSSDKDFLQLVNGRVKVWNAQRKILYNPEKVKEEYGMIPENILSYRVLDGDRSDNIKGVNGIGPKTIKKKLSQIYGNEEFTPYDMIEFAEKNKDKDKKIEKLYENRDIIDRNYKLMQLSDNISEQIKSSIREQFSAKVSITNKFQFKKIFMRDKMWTAFPNVDSWLSVNFRTLDAFAQKM